MHVEWFAVLAGELVLLLVPPPCPVLEPDERGGGVGRVVLDVGGLSDDALVGREVDIVVLVTDCSVVESLGYVRVRDLLALLEGLKKAGVSVLPVVDGLLGDPEEVTELGIGSAEQTQLVRLLVVLGPVSRRSAVLAVSVAVLLGDSSPPRSLFASTIARSGGASTLGLTMAGLSGYGRNLEVIEWHEWVILAL